MPRVPPPAALQHVLLLSRNLENSLRFFADGLGLPVATKTAELASLDVGSNLALQIRQASNEAQCSVGYSPFITFTVRDMDEVVPRLLSMGATLDGPIRYKSYGKTAAVRSPDGHMIGMFEPAHQDMYIEIAAAEAAKHELEQRSTQTDTQPRTTQQADGGERAAPER